MQLESIHTKKGTYCVAETSMFRVSVDLVTEVLPGREAGHQVFLGRGGPVRRGFFCGHVAQDTS